MSGLLAQVMGLVMVVMMGGMVWGVVAGVRRRWHAETKRNRRGRESHAADRGPE